MSKFPIKEFESQSTPFYYYDMELLRNTLDAIKTAAPDSCFHVHYAIKANANSLVIREIAKSGI